MLPAFLEAIRATTQPCTLLLLLPAVVMAVMTDGRWSAFAAMCAGAVLGGWVFIANVVALGDVQVRLSGFAVGAVLALVIAAPNVARLGWADSPVIRAVAAGAVTFAATLWWRPCIGTELGAILTASRRGLPGQFPGMSAYMLGAMVPVLGVVLVLRAAELSPTARRRSACSASAVGLIVTAALAVGRHDELVTTLTRWTVS